MRVLSALAVSLAAALVTAVASGTNGLTIVHPAEIAEPLVKPYCGWGIWVYAHEGHGKAITANFPLLTQ